MRIEGTIQAPQLVASGIRGICAVGLIAACVTAYSDGTLSVNYRATAFAMAMVIVGIVVWLGGSISNKAWRFLGLTSVASACVITMIWAIAYSSPQVGDHGVYWRCASDFRFPLTEWFSSCRGSYLEDPLVYGKRSLAYTLPLGILKLDYSEFKLWNAFIHIVTIIVFYLVAQRAMGEKGGTLATILFVIQPEWWYTITVASADNLALLPMLLALGFYASEKENNRFMDLVLAAVLVSILLIALEWSRSLSIFFMLTAAIFALIAYQPGKVNISIAIALVGPVIFIAVNTALLQYSGIAGNGFELIKTLAEFDVTIRPPGNFQVFFEWSDHLWRSIPFSEKNQFSLIRFADELMHGFASWPSYMVEKIKILTIGTGTAYFVGVDWANNLDTVFTVPENTAPIGAFSMGVSRSLEVLVITIAAFVLIFRPLTRFGQVSMVFTSVFLIIVVGFGQVLSRYGLLLSLPIAIIGGHLVMDKNDRRYEQIAPSKSLIIGMAVLGFVYLLGYSLAKLYQAEYPRPVLSVKQGVPDPGLPQGCNRDLVPIWNYYQRRMRSELSPVVECASYLFPIESGATAVAFFVTREKLRSRHEDRGHAFFRYGYRINSGRIVWEDIDNSDAKWNKISFDGNSQERSTLEVVVERKVAGSQFQFEIRDMLVQY